MSGLDAVRARAGGFMALEGAALDLVQFETLLRERNADDLLAGIAQHQDADGGVRGWRREDGSDRVPTTLRALAFLDALGLLDHPVPEAAVGHLAALQASDGGWGEMTGDLEDRILRTGAIAGFLAKSPFGRSSILAGAEAFLLKHWTVERVQGPSYEPIHAYLHLLTAFSAEPMSEAGDEALQWCGRELERGFRMRAFDPVSVARSFCRARARALPGARIEPDELVTAVITAQDDDGGWTARPGISRLDATLEAIEALERLA